MSVPEGTREELESLFAELGTDERRVLVVLGQRLLAGQRQYGELNLAKDPRNWPQQRAEELEDAVIYTAFEAIKRATG